MAYVNVPHTHEFTLTSRFNAGLHTTLEGFKKSRRVNQTIRALNALDTKTLNDLGIDRSGVRAAAHLAVYGT